MAYGNDGIGAVPRGGRRGGAAFRGRKPDARTARPRPEGFALRKPRVIGTGTEGVRLMRRGVTARRGAFGLGESFVPLTMEPSFRSNFTGIGNDADGLGGLFSKKKKRVAKVVGAPTAISAKPISVRSTSTTYTAPTLHYAVDKKGIARDLTTGKGLSKQEVAKRAAAFSAETGQAVLAATKKKGIFGKIGASITQAATNIKKNPLKNLVLPVVGAAVAGVAVTKGLKAIKAASAAKKLGGAAKKAADVAKDTAKKKGKLDALKKAGGVGLTIAGITAKGKAAKTTAGIEPFAQLPIESAVPGTSQMIPEYIEPIPETTYARPDLVRDTLPPADAGPSAWERVEDLVSTIAPTAPERAASIAQTATDLAQNASLFRDSGAGYSGGGGGGGGFFSGGSSSLPSPTDPSLQPVEEPTIFGVPTKMVLIGGAVLGGLWLATRKRRKGA